MCNSLDREDSEWTYEEIIGGIWLRPFDKHKEKFNYGGGAQKKIIIGALGPFLKNCGHYYRYPIHTGKIVAHIGSDTSLWICSLIKSTSYLKRKTQFYYYLEHKAAYIITFSVSGGCFSYACKYEKRILMDWDTVVGIH